MKHRLPQSYAIAFALLLICFLLPFFEAFGWALQMPICGWYFPLAVLAGMGLLWWLQRRFAPVIYTLLYIVTAVLFASLIFDQYYDSNTYHKDIVEALINGWNPFDNATTPDFSIWAMHYAKLPEASGAAISAFTGEVESAKAFNLLIIGAAAAIVWGALRDIRSKWHRLTVVAIAICNPIVLCQMLTFYTDFFSYLYVLMTVALLLEASRSNSKLWYISIGVITVLAIGTKFNAFFYQGVTLIAAMIWQLFRKQYRPALYIALTGFSALIIGVLILFYHPYITNFASHGHPLYPLMGEGAVDIMTQNTPEFYIGHNRFYNFLQSLLGPLGGASEGWDIIAGVDERVAGFTIFMPIILILAVVCLVIYRKKMPRTVWYITICVAASCFCFEQSWWARYIPQLWLIPVIISAWLAITTENNRWQRILNAACLLAVVLALGTSLLKAGFSTIKHQVVMAELSGGVVVESSETPLTYNEHHRLLSHDIKILPADTQLSDSNLTGIMLDGYCRILVTDNVAERISKRLSQIPLLGSELLNTLYSTPSN